MSQRTYILVNDTAMQTLRSDLADWRKYAGMGKPLTVVVAEHAQRRSTRQNRLYWSLLRELAEGVVIEGRRYDSEFWHEWAKQTLLGVEEMKMPDGTVVRRGISTSSLSVSEFSEFVDRLIAYAATELEIEMSA